MRSIVAILLLGAAACSRVRPETRLPPMPFAVDTVRSQTVSDGVVYHYIYSSTGPWAISVLDIELDRCTRAVAVKGSDVPAGRIRTTTMLSGLSGRGRVLGGVNADFFSLANGTPVGLLVVDGRMLTPPATQPALAFDSAGVPHIDVFERGGTRLLPFQPTEAVGGRPRLLRDSAIVREVDTLGQASFSVGRNPRTAAGFARNGKRLILAVIDGRQKPYSDGMSLRETATLMLALGARDAINLDGGGSSTLVFADPDASGALRIANKPSDKVERAVGDALAIVNRCQ